MLTLQLGPPVPDRLAPTPGADAVQLWRDEAGALLAYAWANGTWRWLAWPGVAAFRFAPETPVVTAFPDGPERPDVIRDVFRRVVRPIALQALGYEALHASAVALKRGAVAFCARTRTGKSTLAFAFACRGYRQLADDAVVLEFGGAETRLVPLPFEPRVNAAAGHDGACPSDPRTQARIGGRRSVGAVTADGQRRAKAGACPSEPVPLAAIFLLTRAPATDSGQAIRLVRVPPARAFPAVLAHAHCFDLAGRDSRSRLLTRYLDLVAKVPVFDLTFRPGFDRLPDLLDAVVAAVEDRPAWPPSDLRSARS